MKKQTSPSQTAKDCYVFTILAKKFQGKTTLGKYLMETLNKPTIIVDIARQFDDNTAYRKTVRGLDELKYFLGNKHFLNAFYKSNMQLIYRFVSDNKKNEAEELFKYLNNNLENITIFCEEMELYANRYLKHTSPIFESFFLARNQQFDIIVIAKIAGQLNTLVKDQTDFWFINTREVNAVRYLDDKSGKAYSRIYPTLNDKEFLMSDLNHFYKKFKLNKKTIQIIK